MLKQTPLYDAHVALGARMVDFGGWNMPVQYDGIIPEAEATRQRVGLFDIGHMGRVELVGPDATAAADWVLSCNVGVLKPGRVKYGFLLTEQGTVIDDTLVYCDEDRIHVVVNAGNRDRDRDHIREQVAAKGFDCRVLDAAEPDEDDIEKLWLGAPQHMLALQGPRSEDLLQRIISTQTDLSELGYYKMCRTRVLSYPALVSRTGYTGEDGFEIFFPRDQSNRFWTALLAEGSDLGVAPIGLGARDALRLEAGMPLYGNELDLETTPLDANLTFGLSFKKGDYLGRKALEEQKERGCEKTLVGIEVDTRRVPRHGCPLLENGERIGVVTSGSFGPTVGKNVATGFVPPRLAEVGSSFDVDIRGKVHGCKVVPLPFYKRQK
jgi:aminomethyltransferase